MRFRLVPIDEGFYALFDEAAENVAETARRLRGMLTDFSELEAIDRLESEADTVYRRSVADLFSGEYRALDVLKWKDVFEALEHAVNRIESIGGIVESIAVKHA